MEKIREQQRKREEELAQRKKEYGENRPLAKTDTTDFADDLVTAIENGALNEVEESELLLTSLPEPEQARKEEREVSKKNTPKKETTKENAASASASEKKESENKSPRKEESQSLSSMLLFQAKQEAKSCHRSVTLRPTTVKKATMLLDTHYNGLSFNDLMQQLLDVWVAENEKMFNQ